MTRFKHKYLCGNAFKELCKYSCSHYTDARSHDFDFRVKHEVENNYVFVKTEYLGHFFKYIKLDFPFVLFTHNSDLPIDENFLNYIENPQVQLWYGQNINIDHPKVKSIPIGLANPKWAHGNPNNMDKAINRAHWKDKENLVYCNFDIGTNPFERSVCLEETGLEMAARVSSEEYLKQTGKSYFTLSPNGNGIDCHKHWESFHLKTIPIVTKSKNIDFYNHLPFLVIDSWKEYRNLDLSQELYDKIWGNFDPSTLFFENYVKNI